MSSLLTTCQKDAGEISFRKELEASGPNAKIYFILFNFIFLIYHTSDIVFELSAFIRFIVFIFSNQHQHDEGPWTKMS